MVYWRGQKEDVPLKNLSHTLNHQTICQSNGISCFDIVRRNKPLFANKRLKVNAENYRKHPKKLLFPVINKIDPQKDWIFIQDGVMSHTSNLVQDFLKETILWCYIKKDRWTPKPPDRNPLDHYFCKKVKMKVYENRVNTLFEQEEEMISKIKSVWKESA